MTSTERRQKIMQAIREYGSGKVDDFASEFNVSTVTIRHDLNLLEKQGCIFRCYGGATLNPHFAFELPLYHKRQVNRSIKDLIASTAANLIHDGDTVILDSGSTIARMTAYLANKKQLVVMTNSLNTAYQLSGYENIDLHVVGGQLRRSSCSLIGHQGEDQILGHRFDKLFLGVDGFDLTAGITTPDANEACINRAMCSVANEIIAVADSSKFGRKSFCMIRESHQINTLITDSNISHHYHDKLLSLGVEVIIADNKQH
ncbi:DeoR/GlpR transcriptional regulator [Photobacterium damselae subsp. damselae]|uniref:DeoR/GlpR transcriptional regulator n=1 Tax=Photobacterium damselae subsp. damselae TaxID=85581 RepID=A0A850QXL7_PHODD|nr:transcriptional repressor AgaR [Photobacterium damselae]MBA5684380.1 DeoR/GlpR transcriptional regulator [Photobacterium damselae subsp. damselae]NVH51679.1 DeoR/GlpR transcriptional regulator [Photobacterium damselae subsp. damselae]NVO81155.1 DeoR/GlpR transcriptional regulator [Photobacterium damselae subsp. damselae]NVP01118.1 DeoR/GlpR transcriptional regulator [Photobacterium damselae subsp. damselae]TLS85350.1 DeoR/GlpR transcriptional regulator [Photobacterium damselae subsp. damsel